MAIRESNCFLFLNSYGDLINAQGPNIVAASNASQILRPHPVFFTGLDCANSLFPTLNMDIAMTNPQNINNPFGNLLKALYIPPNWQVILYQGANQSGNSKTFNPSLYPTIIPDVSSTYFDNTIPPNSMSIKDNVRSLTLASKAANTSAYITSEQWSIDTCNNRTSSVVGARQILYLTSSQAPCDNVMSVYCASTSNNAPDCICLLEEQQLRGQYCHPGSTNPNCATQNNLSQFIPVTCLGKNCSVSGYRFQRMLQQPCQTTACEQILDVIGTDISISGSAALYCGQKLSGNSLVTITPTPTPTPSFNILSASNPDALGSSIYLIIGIAIIIMCLILPASFIIFIRSYKQDEEEEIAKFSSTRNTIRVVRY